MCKVLEMGMRLECGRNEGRPGWQKHREQDRDWQERTRLGLARKKLEVSLGPDEEELGFYP